MKFARSEGGDPVDCYKSADVAPAEDHNALRRFAMGMGMAGLALSTVGCASISTAAQPPQVQMQRVESRHETTPAKTESKAHEAGRQVGQVGREIGQQGAEAGKAIGRQGAEVGKAIGHQGAEVGKAIGQKGKEIGKGAAEVGKSIGHGFRDFFRGVAGKD